MGDGANLKIFPLRARVADQPKWRKLTLCLQIALLAPLVAHITGAVNCDTPIAVFWTWFLEQSWHKEALLEAIVAAVSFLSWIVVFRTLDTMTPAQQFRFFP